MLLNSKEFKEEVKNFCQKKGISELELLNHFCEINYKLVKEGHDVIYIKQELKKEFEKILGKEEDQ